MPHSHWYVVCPACRIVCASNMYVTKKKFVIEWYTAFAIQPPIARPVKNGSWYSCGYRSSITALTYWSKMPITSVGSIVNATL